MRRGSVRCGIHNVRKCDNSLGKSSDAPFRNSKTGDYVFNNGWLGVIAAKLYAGKDTSAWVKKILQPGVTLFDNP